MDEIKPVNALLVAKILMDTSAKCKKESFQILSTGKQPQDYVKGTLKEYGSAVLVEAAKGVLKTPALSIEDLRAALIQAIKSPETAGKKLFWNEDGPDSVCPICGYACDDIYYIENFCTKCGARLYSIYDPDVEVEE